MTRIAQCGLVLIGLLAALTWWPLTVAASHQQNPELQPPAQVSETPAPPVTPNSGATPTPGVTATPSPTATTTIVENIFHIIRFPFETMTDAVVQMSNRIALNAYRDAGSRFAGALDRMIFGEYGLAPATEAGAATPLFANIIWPHWQATMALGLLLLPVTLLLTAVSALRLGATSALGLVDLKEALLSWLLTAGAAGASYYLLGLVHRLSTAAALSILRLDTGDRVTGETLAGAFFNVAALISAFFALFLASSVMIGLGLALAACTALVYLLTTLAPVVLMLSSLPPLRWLQGLWLKAVTITFLVPVIDALLIKAAVSMFYGVLNAQGSGDLGTFVSGVFVTAGVISVLIAINYKVGEMVFGALAEVHRRAWDAATGVAQLAVLAGGMALGGVAAGAVGAGAGMAGTGTLAGGAGTGASAAAGSTASSTSAGAASAAPGGASVSSASTGSIASRLAGLFPGSSASGSAQPPSGTDNVAAGPAQGMSGLAANPTPEGDARQSPRSESNTPERASASHAQPTPNPSGSSAPAPHQAQLAQSLGRALTLGSSNPLLRSLGAGLQLGSTLGDLHQRSTAGMATTSAQRPAEVDDAMRWSKQNLSHWPNDLFTLGRDNTALMAGGLHQAFVNSGRATHMEDMLRLAHGSYGAWRNQGEPGGLDAQRELFEAHLDDANKNSPGTFIGAFQAVAEKHGFRLDDGFPEEAQAAFARSRDTGLGPRPGRDLYSR